MAKIRYEGREVELAEDWRMGELIRAENALDIDMDTAKGAARLALVVFISFARVEPWKTMQPGTLADLVLRMELTKLGDPDEEDEAGPPAEEPDPDSEDQDTGSDSEDPPTTGLRLSD